MINKLLVAAASLTITYPVHVINCHDGDTCTVDITLEDYTHDLGMDVTRHTITTLTQQHVRLCGLNAPELPAPEGIATRDALLTWLRAAKDIELRTTQTKDKYGRWLGYLIADGVDLNARLLAEKLAVPFMGCK